MLKLFIAKECYPNGSILQKTDDVVLVVFAAPDINHWSEVVELFNALEVKPMYWPLSIDESDNWVLTEIGTTTLYTDITIIDYVVAEC